MREDFARRDALPVVVIGAPPRDAVHIPYDLDVWQGEKFLI